MYLSSEPGVCAQLDSVEAAVLKHALAKRVQGSLGHFFSEGVSKIFYLVYLTLEFFLEFRYSEKAVLTK